MPETKIFTVIACNAFRDALAHLKFPERYPGVRFRYLPASLHLKPAELKRCMLQEIQSAGRPGYGICCLYGHCFPDIDDVLKEKNVVRISCSHCYETLLGTRQFNAVLSEQPGSFFMEKELVQNFDAYCWQPLEFDDPELRQMYFHHYRQAVYIRQPQDPDLTREALQIAERLALHLKIVDSDYEELNDRLTELLNKLNPDEKK